MCSLGYGSLRWTFMICALFHVMHITVFNVYFVCYTPIIKLFFFFFKPGLKNWGEFQLKDTNHCHFQWPKPLLFSPYNSLKNFKVFCYFIFLGVNKFLKVKSPYLKLWNDDKCHRSSLMFSQPDTSIIEQHLRWSFFNFLYLFFELWVTFQICKLLLSTY